MSIKDQIRSKKLEIRKSVSKAREACAGSASHYHDYESVKSLVAQARLKAFSLGLGKIEESLNAVLLILEHDGGYSDRIIADGVLCDILNRLDRELE